MIFNETRQFTFVQRNDEEFIASDPAIVVYKPDQSEVSPALTAALDPGTSSLTQELFSTTTVLDMGGLWRIVWEDKVGDEVLHPTDYVFVSYTDLARQIRLTMGRSTDELSDELIDLYVSRVVRILELDYPLLPSYAELVGNDRLLMDEALTLFVSAYLNPDIATTKPSSSMIGVTIGSDTFKFSDKDTSKQGVGKDDWLGQAYQIFSRISTLQDQFEDLYNAPLFVASGPRRNSRTRLSLPEATTSRYDLFSDARMSWDWNRLYASYIN